MYRALIRPILFALSVGDAEKAHILAMRAMGKIQKIDPLLRLIGWWYQAGQNCQSTAVAGIPFPNKIGLAAGMDKNAEALLFLQALGFGFIEIGTVLPRPQTGNPRPRLFRISKEQALINRMGFNSQGMSEVFERLSHIRGKINIPLGGSLGKMKETPNEIAVQDYIAVWYFLRPYVQYGVANLSSPNTPGLRELQGGKYIENFVRTLVAAERKEAAMRGNDDKPMFIKLAPDLTEAELAETIGASESAGARGFIVGNTSLARPLAKPDTETAKEVGGLSGHPIYYPTRAKFRIARKLTKLPIMFVGGLDSKERIKEAFGEGADLIQLMSGVVYKGPSLVSAARRAA